MTVRIDVENGIVVAAFLGTPVDDDFDKQLPLVAKEIERTVGAVVLVFDGTTTEGITAKQREKAAAWLRSSAPLLSRRTKGIAFVIKSPLLRGALTAIFWLQKPPGPYVIVETLAEARAWARSRIADAHA